MAIYRQLHTEFWQDDLMLELTPEDKYFYIYLLTNPKVTQCGIYKFLKKLVSLETGFTVEVLDNLLQRFVDYKKILYSKETNEVMILNWHRYNNTFNNRNTRICINRDLKKVKCQDFIDSFYANMKKECKVDLFLDEMFDDIPLNVNSKDSSNLDNAIDEPKDSEDTVTENNPCEVSFNLHTQNTLNSGVESSLCLDNNNFKGKVNLLEMFNDGIPTYT